MAWLLGMKPQTAMEFLLFQFEFCINLKTDSNPYPTDYSQNCKLHTFRSRTGNVNCSRY